MAVTTTMDTFLTKYNEKSKRQNRPTMASKGKLFSPMSKGALGSKLSNLDNTVTVTTDTTKATKTTSRCSSYGIDNGTSSVAFSEDGTSYSNTHDGWDWFKNSSDWIHIEAAFCKELDSDKYQRFLNCNSESNDSHGRECEAFSNPLHLPPPTPPATPLPTPACRSPQGGDEKLVSHKKDRSASRNARRSKSHTKSFEKAKFDPRNGSSQATTTSTTTTKGMRRSKSGTVLSSKSTGKAIIATSSSVEETLSKPFSWWNLDKTTHVRRQECNGPGDRKRSSRNTRSSRTTKAAASFSSSSDERAATARPPSTPRRVRRRSRSNKTSSSNRDGSRKSTKSRSDRSRGSKSNRSSNRSSSSSHRETSSKSTKTSLSAKSRSSNTSKSFETHSTSTPINSVGAEQVRREGKPLPSARTPPSRRFSNKPPSICGSSTRRSLRAANASILPERLEDALARARNPNRVFERLALAILVAEEEDHIDPNLVDVVDAVRPNLLEPSNVEFNTEW